MFTAAYELLLVFPGHKHQVQAFASIHQAEQQRVPEQKSSRVHTAGGY